MPPYGPEVDSLSATREHACGSANGGPVLHLDDCRFQRRAPYVIQLAAAASAEPNLVSGLYTEPPGERRRAARRGIPDRAADHCPSADVRPRNHHHHRQCRRRNAVCAGRDCALQSMTGTSAPRSAQMVTESPGDALLQMDETVLAFTVGLADQDIIPCDGAAVAVDVSSRFSASCDPERFAVDVLDGQVSVTSPDGSLALLAQVSQESYLAKTVVPASLGAP